MITQIRLEIEFNRKQQEQKQRQNFITRMAKTESGKKVILIGQSVDNRLSVYCQS